MRIAFLGSETSWYLQDLRRAAQGRHRIEPFSFSSLQGTIVGEASDVLAGKIRVNDFDAVLVRTMPPGSLEQVVVRMDLLASLTTTGTPVINPPKAIEAAVDKYLTTCRLQQAGLLVPRTITCQTAADADEAFQRLGGDVVLKPIFGGEGRGLVHLTDATIAQQTFQQVEQRGGAIYLQEFIEHEGCDLRLLVIGERVLAIRRCNPFDWRTNLSRGATAEPYHPSPDEEAMARRAAVAVGAVVAGVDLLPGRDGKLYAIEVNAVPGWQGVSRATGEDVAQLLLEFMMANF